MTSTTYIIKSKEGRDYFLKGLMDSGIMEELNPFLIYRKSEIVCLEFTANKVETAKEFFHTLNDKYNYIIKLLWCLNKQQESLKKIGYGIYHLDLDNILVINSSIFVLNKVEFVRKVEDDAFVFLTPLILNDFSAPQLKHISVLPSRSNVASFNYTLGAIAFYILTGGVKYNDDDEYNDDKWEVVLKSIYKTKLYWTIIRCLKEQVLFFI
jgi:hypothetical protein